MLWSSPLFSALGPVSPPPKPSPDGARGAPSCETQSSLRPRGEGFPIHVPPPRWGRLGRDEGADAWLRLSGIGVAVLLALLPGCGFKPLYGRDSASHAPATAVQFAEIELPPIRSLDTTGAHTGQQMRNFLIDDLHPGGAAADYKYRLNVTVREANINLGIQQNTTSTRGQVRLTVDYYLVDQATGQTLLKETLRTSVGYDILTNQFSSVLSAADAREQGLQQMAGDLTEHLALYFATQKQGQPPRT